MEWISVKNRLPEKEQKVLCYDVNDENYDLPFLANYETRGISFWIKHKDHYEQDYKDVIGFFNEGDCCNSPEEINNVTHWMSLPDKPERNNL
jgi:hypothetical protein